VALPFGNAAIDIALRKYNGDLPHADL